MSDRAKLSRVIDELRREDAAVPSPADMVSLARLDRQLSDLGYPPLSPGYKSFLELADGLIFDGTTLHGSRLHQISVESTEVTIPALADMLKERLQAGRKPGALLPVGLSDTDLVQIDPNSNAVIACEPYSGEEFERWDDMATYLSSLL
ncbi:MAG: hypothetical protein Alpg2KO_33310 [Alphaproteobacteria bacterium]